MRSVLNNLRRAAALLLCGAMLFGLCGCSADITGILDTVLGPADSEETGTAAVSEPFIIETIVPTPAPETDDGTDETFTADFPEENTEETDPIQQIIDSMTLEEKTAQLFFIALDGLTGVESTDYAGDVTHQALLDFPVGGIVLFADNISDPDQLTQLTASLQEYSQEAVGVPLLIGIDEEGGTVTRIAQNSAFGITDVGAMADIGATGDTSAAYNAGYTIGSYLAQYGINIDLAPDADVLTNPDNTVIGTRSFGSDPELVSQMAQQYYNGLQDNGVHGCLKHFPGHGATAADTHEGMSYTDKTLDELMQSELIPFIDGVGYDADMIMAAHISLPSVTGDYTPASLSYDIITGLLREQLGYDGVIVTDALNMGAVADYYTSSEAALAALEAGVDMLMYAGDATDAWHAVIAAVQDGTISEEQIDASVYRILSLKYS